MAPRTWLACLALALAAGCREPECVPGDPRACDDGNVCTDDACVEGTGCTHAPNGASCDGCGADACCTSVCAAGACRATPYEPVCDGACGGACDEARCPDDCAPPPCPDGCPSGFACLPVDGAGTDTAFACVPERESACAGGTDEDVDTWTDCGDPDCATEPGCVPSAAEVCDNRTDDDGDAQTDCDDPGCAAEPRCTPAAEVCDNATDDDADARTDCDDPACAAEPSCTARVEVCDNATDEDGDGLTDCADGACAAEPWCAPAPVEGCDNATDDDGDGATDCLDADCGGLGPCVQEALPGDVVITEIMIDPSSVTDEAGEWIEIRNRTTAAIDVRGWVLHDLDPVAPQWHVVRGPAPVVLPAGGTLVLGALADPARNGGVAVGYAWATFGLDDGADEVVLEARGEPIDTVRYATPAWPVARGRSLSLDPGHLSASANDSAASWCAGATAYNGQDLGTPGAANAACP